MAFNFPDPSGGTTKVTNTETGISYVWLDPPGKWVVDGESYASVAGNAVWEGDAPPDPIGDYKLWYSTDTLELYFHYCDINGSCAWVPTSAPITMLDSLIDEVNATGDDVAVVKRNLIEIETQFDVDQLRQDKAIVLLEGEIEQLAPSFARGTWNWDDGDGYVDEGEYVMRGTQTQESRDKMLEPLNQELNACLAASQDPTDQSACLRAYDEAAALIPDVGESVNTYDWEITNEVEFSNYDSQGNIQTFEDVKVGQLLDMVCPDGAFMVAEITKVTSGMWYENPKLEYKPLTTKGDANGLTKLKIFSIDDGIEVDDLNNFVRKSGDTMTGDLLVHKRLWIKTEDSSTNGWNDGNVFVVNQQDATQGSIVRIKQNGTDRLKVMFDGNTSLEGNKLTNIAPPEASKDGANKEYVDNAITGIQGGSGGLFEPSLWTLDEGMDRDETTKGKFCYDGSNFYMATSNANGNTWGPGAAGGRTTNAWVTIYSTDGRLMHSFEVNKIFFKEKYGKKYVTEFDWAWEYSTNTLVDGEQYKIVVPGFLT